MIKVFLVEDEITIREGIKKRINWEENGFLLVGEASDGELAYPMIQETQPQILITDIKMPFMDGLELSKLVKDEMPEIKIIILSGYDDFSFAKQAITIGITDYMLKPVAADKLLAGLMRTKELIEEEQRQKVFMDTFLKEMEENRKIDRYQFFNELISGSHSVAELVEKGKEMKVDLVSMRYNMVLFKSCLTENGDNSEYREQQIALDNSLEYSFTESEDVVYFNLITEGAALLIKGKTQEEIDSTIKKSLDLIIQITNGYEGGVYFVGVGSTVTRLRDIPKCYYNANKAFAYRFLVKGNQVLYSSDIDGDKVLDNVNINLSKIDIKQFDKTIVENFLKNGLKNDIEIFVGEYIRNVGEANMNSVMFRQYIVMDINFAAISFAEALGWGKDHINERFPDFGNIVIFLNTMDMTKQYLVQTFRVCIDLRELATLNRYDSLIENAKEFIKAHYNDEKISLNAAAASVNVSPNHFSRIFSQEAGMTFVEYLTDIRMEKAKELLSCTNMKTSEIGYEVGYKDSHYFCYLFKKMSGCTPKEYRMRSLS